MNVIRHQRRWINLLYKVVFLMTAIVWATAPQQGNAAVFAAVLLLAFSMPSMKREIRQSEHPAALGAAGVALAAALLINRAFELTPLMLAIWAGLAVVGLVAWLRRPAVPGPEDERALTVMSGDV